MTKKSTSLKKSTMKLSKKVASMKMHTKIISGVLAVMAITIGVVAVVNATLAQAARKSDSVPLTSTAQASASAIRVATLGNTINVQFDYDLVNGAESAIVTAALSSQRAFDPVIVTGPGRYNETLTDVADGTYYISLVLSGNPHYALGDPGPANKVLFITIPDTQKTKSGDPFVREIRKFFHHQQKNF